MTSTLSNPRASGGARRDGNSATGGDGALVARIRLGRIFTPVSMEWVVIACTALLLTIFGVVMVTSATSVVSVESGNTPYSGGESQAIYAVAAMLGMLLMSRLPIRWVRKLAVPALLLGLLLQAVVFTPLGEEVGGNRNWIRIGGFSIQPAEFLKLALAMWIAFIFWRNRKRLHRVNGVILLIAAVTLIVLASVMLGRDLGTAAVLALIALGALYFAGVRLRYIVLPVLAVGAGAIAFTATSPNRMSRMMTVFGDCLEPDQVLGICYQPLHGVWGLASGGLFGLGLGSSMEKYGWLPAIADDYIFALVGEELGLIGCIVLMGLYGVFAWAGLRIVRRTDDVFVRVACGAIIVWIIGQALVNIGVVLRLFPPLGVPLPFLSAGGSSLLALGLACGVLLAGAASLPVEPQKAPAVRGDRRAAARHAPAQTVATKRKAR